MITLAVLLTCADYIGGRRETGWRETEEEWKRKRRRNSPLQESRARSRGREGVREKEGGKEKEDSPEQEAGVEVGWRRRGFKMAVWGGVLAIAGSRLVISTHFLHQVVCGVIVGILLHRVMCHCVMSYSHKVCCVCLSVCLSV